MNGVDCPLIRGHDQLRLETPGDLLEGAPQLFRRHDHTMLEMPHLAKQRGLRADRDQPESRPAQVARQTRGGEPIVEREIDDCWGRPGKLHYWCLITLAMENAPIMPWHPPLLLFSLFASRFRLGRTTVR